MPPAPPREWTLRLRQLHPPARQTCYDDIRYFHGLPGDKRYISGIRRQRTSDGIPDKAMEVWDRINWNNIDYLRKKWGCPKSPTWDDCANTRPFNDSANPVGFWRLDPEFRKKQAALVAERDAVFRLPNHTYTIPY